MNPAPEAPVESDLDLILFRVGGVRYGADAAQVVSATALRGKEPADARWFHDAMGYPDAEVSYANPVVLSLRTVSTALIIDGLEDLVRVPISDMRPLPTLLEPMAHGRGVWAVATWNKSLILLVDLLRVAAPSCGAPSGTVTCHS